MDHVYLDKVLPKSYVILMDLIKDLKMIIILLKSNTQWHHLVQLNKEKANLIESLQNSHKISEKVLKH
jgi:hypothetical protein